MTDCAWLSEGSRHLYMHWVSSLGCWLLGRASSHSGLPSFTFGLVWMGVFLPERQKLEVSSPISHSVGSGKGLQVMVLTARDDAEFSAEVPPDGPDSRGLLRLEAASISLIFLTKLYILGPRSWKDYICGPERL